MEETVGLARSGLVHHNAGLMHLLGPCMQLIAPGGGNVEMVQ